MKYFIILLILVIYLSAETTMTFAQSSTITTTENLLKFPCVGRNQFGNVDKVIYHMPQGIPETHNIVRAFVTVGFVEIYFADYESCIEFDQKTAFEGDAIYYAESGPRTPFSEKPPYEKSFSEWKEKYGDIVTLSEFNGYPIMIFDQTKLPWRTNSDTTNALSVNSVPTESVPTFSQLSYVDTDEQRSITIRANGDPAKLLKILNMTLNPGEIVDHTKILKLDDFAYQLWRNHYFIIDGTILDVRELYRSERVYDVQINNIFKPLGHIGTSVLTIHGVPNFDSIKGDRGIFFIKRTNTNFEFGEFGAKSTSSCSPEMMYHHSKLIHPSLTKYSSVSAFDLDDSLRCYPAYYREYIPEYIQALDTSVPNPHIQQSNGILPYHVICKEGLNLLLKPSEFVVSVCVTSPTYDELLTRGWSLVFSWS